jgi:peptidoglycan/LPS O-acetylase OafA/YrhL
MEFRPARIVLSDRARASLDALRGLAAIYVVFHHTVAWRGGLFVVFSFGQEAVIVFFLLSGFVIFSNENHRTQNIGNYLMRRLIRIYPMLLVAMLISSVLALTGLVGEKFTLCSFIGTIFSVQDISQLKPGVIVDPFLGNAPLWTLSYEVFFYLAFPFVMRVFVAHVILSRLLVGVSACALLGSYLLLPNHFSLVGGYFYTWWLGAVLAYSYSQKSLRFSALKIELIFGLVLILISLLGCIHYAPRGLGVFPLLTFRHFCSALAFFAMALSPMRRIVSRGAAALGNVPQFIASISFGVYIFHFPIVVQTGAFNSTVTFWAAIFLTFALAFIVERKLLIKIPRPSS